MQNSSKELTKQVDKLDLKPGFRSQGEIVSLGDGVAWLDGLDNAMFGEMVDLGHGITGLVMNLESEKIGIIVFGDYTNLRLGDKAYSTGKLLSIGVSDDILGRVIDANGSALDGKGDYKIEKNMPTEKIAPGIIDRKPVTMPLQTGVKAIDSMIPIGRGQRELIIGDRGTGKSALAIDTIINQKDSDVVCIYVSVGQKRAKIAKVVETLDSFGVLEKTVVVAASASDSAPARYLAPYTGCAIGEYFMQKGKHALVIYDDLSKHAWSYREISLLLRRPSGREAYPGDVFYLHSKLLERSCQLSDELGGGSLTALPIIETQAGDVSAYIPTNVISITDGQIYLESDLFFAGIRPAVSVGLSVSRIGGAAQVKAMKKISGTLRLELSQYFELATFAQFASDLDPATKSKIERGKRIIEILKQPQYIPYSVEKQVVVIFLAVSGYLDDLPVEKIDTFEQEFLKHMESGNKDILKEIKDKKEMDDKLEEKLKKVIDDFKAGFAERYALKISSI
jgi:F-type H+/Na+-transporting ATPase subunit alpha